MYSIHVSIEGDTVEDQTYGVRWKVDSGSCRFQIENCADEGRILMREAIMFLTSPGACLDIVDRR